ncbi:MAG: hypothetical protein DLM72_18705 [Candidatus Nitrosopolaris wilkensis]|nr:MAG: hypothetical protein DLM72_18705 [Candidatus Nitrosopolaris wilkensis]
MGRNVVFIKWDGLWYPCCGYRLTTKPCKLKYKAKSKAKNINYCYSNNQMGRNKCVLFNDF